MLLDQRCHGASLGLPGLDPPHTVDAMAGDALATLLWGMQEGR